MLEDIESETIGLSEDLRAEDPAREHVVIDAFSSGPMMQQGGFVASFTLTSSDEALALALTRTQLVQLQAECDPSDDVVHDWRRVRGKKGSRVRLWERGSASALTHTGVDGKLKAQRRQTAAQRRNHRVSRVEHDPTEPPTAASRDRETYAVRSSITVSAPLSSVMKALDCSTVTSYRSFTKIIYEDLVADTKVLTHKRLNHPDRRQAPHLAESLAVRWIVCKSPSPLVWDCDLCLVEYSKVHTIDELIAAGDAPSNNNHDDPLCTKICADGLRVRERLPAAIKIVRSIETKHCPMLCDPPHHLERVNIPLGGFLLYTTDNDETTDVVFFMSVSYERKKQTSRLPKPFLSSDERQFRAIQYALQNLALSIGRISNAVDAYTMSLQLETIRHTRWIENSNRSECSVCYHQFHPITRRRHHCRLCGDVICYDCSIHKDADLPTIGPTTLRICTICDMEYFGRASMLTSSTSGMKKTALALQKRELALETATLASPTVLRSRRQTVISIERSAESSKSVLGDFYLESPRGKITKGVGTLRRHGVSQPLSCPKPKQGERTGLLGKWAERNQYVAAVEPSRVQFASPTNKWPNVFTAKRITPTILTKSPYGSYSTVPPLPRYSISTPSAPPSSSRCVFAQSMPLPRYLTKLDQNLSSRAVSFGRIKGLERSLYKRPLQQSSDDLGLDSSLNQKKTASAWFSSPVSEEVVPPSVSMMPPTESDNQSSSRDHSPERSYQSCLSLRACIEHIEKYEDLICEMCDRAIDATGAKYSAVSIFKPLSPKSATNEASTPTVHYLKVKESPKLMKIAANLKCCEPVLRFSRPIATRDAQNYCLDGYEFGSLPFVKGPQHARFYAGVPLVDSKDRLLGALSVFDDKVVCDEGEFMDSLGFLTSIARATVTRIEDRQVRRALEEFVSTSVQLQTRIIGSSHDAGRSRSEADKIESNETRTTPRQIDSTSACMPPSSLSKTNTQNYYKQQMYRLVQQANRSQDHVLQTSIKTQGVSF